MAISSLWNWYTMSKYVNPFKELNYELGETYKGVGKWFTGGDAEKFTTSYPVLAGTVAAGLAATPFVRNLVSGGMVAGQAINKVLPGGTNGSQKETQVNTQADTSGLWGSPAPAVSEARPRKTPVKRKAVKLKPVKRKAVKRKAVKRKAVKRKAVKRKVKTR